MDKPDIVQQLRARNERFQSQHGNLLYYGGGDSILDCEAAKEIERLRSLCESISEDDERHIRQLMALGVK